MWLANFEDGKSIGGTKCYWTDLPKDKKITGVQMINPNAPNMFVSLKNYDFYYFVNEAVGMYGQEKGSVVAEILGGHDLALGVGTEVRMEVSGSVKVRTYPIEKFRFTKDSLREGKKNGRPSLDTDLPQSVNK